MAQVPVLIALLVFVTSTMYLLYLQNDTKLQLHDALAKVNDFRARSESNLQLKNSLQKSIIELKSLKLAADEKIQHLSEEILNSETRAQDDKQALLLDLDELRDTKRKLALDLEKVKKDLIAKDKELEVASRERGQFEADKNGAVEEKDEILEDFNECEKLKKTQVQMLAEANVEIELLRVQGKSLEKNLGDARAESTEFKNLAKECKVELDALKEDFSSLKKSMEDLKLLEEKKALDSTHLEQQVAEKLNSAPVRGPILTRDDPIDSKDPVAVKSKRRDSKDQGYIDSQSANINAHAPNQSKEKNFEEKVELVKNLTAKVRQLEDPKASQNDNNALAEENDDEESLPTPAIETDHQATATAGQEASEHPTVPSTVSTANEEPPPEEEEEDKEDEEQKEELMETEKQEEKVQQNEQTNRDEVDQQDEKEPEVEDEKENLESNSNKDPMEQD